jgi:hypothetical protein
MAVLCVGDPASDAAPPFNLIYKIVYMKIKFIYDLKKDIGPGEIAG